MDHKATLETLEGGQETLKAKDASQVLVYERLDASKHEIRLVDLAPSGRGSEADKDFEPGDRLIRTSLDQHEAYHALSWTWGTSDRNAQILIDGKVLPISTNLHKALKHVRDKTQRQRFWIDAISINQDDPVEKATQVSVMDQIFARAHKIHCFLGEPSYTSDAIISFLENIAPFHPMTQGEICYDDWMQLNSGVSAAIENCSVRDEVFSQGLDEFWKRSYWRRIWIVQEIAAGHDKIEFICGQARADFWSIFNGFMVFRRWLNESFLRGKNVLVGGQQYKMHSHHPLALYVQSAFAQRQSPKLGAILLHLLSICVGQSLEASDARDMIYAVLGLAQDTRAIGISPDYVRSWQSLYVDAMAKLLSIGWSDLLYFAAAQHDTPNIPSWVINWSIMSKRYHSFHIMQNTNTLKPTDFTHEARASYEGDGAKLSLKGQFMGAVHSIGRPWNPPDDEEELIPYMRSWILDLKSFLQTIQDQFASDFDLSDVLWRLPIGISKPWTGIVASRLTDATEERLKYGFDNLCTPHARPSDTAEGRTVQESSAVQYLNFCRFVLASAQPISLSNGFVGLASVQIQPEDLFVLPVGLSTPLVLGQRSDGCHKLVGDAYIYNSAETYSKLEDRETQLFTVC